MSADGAEGTRRLARHCASRAEECGWGFHGVVTADDAGRADSFHPGQDGHRVLGAALAAEVLKCRGTGNDVGPACAKITTVPARTTTSLGE